MNFAEAYEEMKKGKVVGRGKKRKWCGRSYQRLLRMPAHGGNIEMKDTFGWTPAQYFPPDLDATDWEVIE